MLVIKKDTYESSQVHYKPLVEPESVPSVINMGPETERSVGALLDVNLAPVCIEFGGIRWRGFFELSFGTSYIYSGGVKYRF